MTGAIPRSLMTDAELDALARDTGEHGEALYVPTPAGVAHAGSHLGVPQPRQYTELIRPAGGDAQASESTGPKIPEGRERPEGDARRLQIRGAGLLARLAAHDEALILALGVILCVLAIALIAASATPGWLQ